MSQAFTYYGTVFPNGSAVFLARVVGEYSEVLKRTDLSSAKYTASLVDTVSPELSTPVSGHENAALNLEDVFFNALQTDGTWNADTLGYNFRHIPQVHEAPLFTHPHRFYQLDYTFYLTDTARPPVRVQFRVFCR